VTAGEGDPACPVAAAAPAAGIAATAGGAAAPGTGEEGAAAAAPPDPVPEERGKRENPGFFSLVFLRILYCVTLKKIPVSPQDGPLCVHLLCKPSHVHPSNFGDFALSATSRALRSNYPFLPTHEKCSAIFASRCQRNRHTTQPPIRRIFESSFLLPLTTSRFDPPLSSVDKVHIFLYYFEVGIYLISCKNNTVKFSSRVDRLFWFHKKLSMRCSIIISL
jgi:hypothetical protein